MSQNKDLLTFTSQNFEEIFDQIIDLEINEDEIKEFLLELNAANLPTNSFIGAVKSLKKRMKHVSAPQDSIDVCGTGGDKLNTLNVSTAVCFVVAASGVTVAKHGNKAISSNSGSADIFSELGIKISSDISEIEKNLTENKLCFLFAPFFHDALKNVAQIRRSLGIPTIFNFLGPLLNPANTGTQLIGVSKRSVISKILQTFQTLSPEIKAQIVHGFDGMDEITLSDNSYSQTLEDRKIHPEEIIDPTQLGFKKVSLEELKGKDPKYNAQKLTALLQGEKSAYRDIVVLNSAFALKLAGKVTDISSGKKLAESLIDDGKAQMILDNLRKI